MSNEKTILLVDDEEFIRETLSRSLTRRGYNVTTAISGLEGFKLFQLNHHDCVVTDLVMEEFGGLEMARDIKKLSPETPIIFVTGCGTAKSAIEALRLGASDYFEKPCDVTALASRISRCMEHSVPRNPSGNHNLAVCPICTRMNDKRKNFDDNASWMPLTELLEKISSFRIDHRFCPNCASLTLEDIRNYFGNLVDALKNWRDKDKP